MARGPKLKMRLLARKVLRNIKGFGFDSQTIFSMLWGEGTSVQDLLQFMREKGFDFEPQLTEKDSFQQFKTPTRKGWFAGSKIKTKSGQEAIIANFGDWRTGEKYTFKSSGDFGDDTKEIERRIKAQQKAEGDARDAQRAETAKIAQTEWAQITDSKFASHYLTKKKITEKFGCKTQKTSFGTVNLIVPVRDLDGVLWGFQQISEDGSKAFLPGQRTQGLFHLIGEIDPNGTLYIAEGFATGATVHMATGKPVVCAFFGDNLGPVGEAIRLRYPSLKIVFAGDDDRFSDQGNSGKDKATKAALAASATCVFPVFKSLDSKPTDFNDLACAEGLGIVTAQLEQHEPVPPSLFIKTEHTGFHSEKMVGAKVVKTPEYEDLRRFFERSHHYKVMSAARQCYVWNGKHYEQMDKSLLENFAHKHFRPIADNRMVSEFVGLVLRSNVTPYEWFESDTRRKINFQNGYLDLNTDTFHEHTPEIGFRNVLTYSYDSKAVCPNFDSMLAAVTCNDEALQKVLLEFIGYSISQDSCWAQKAMVFEGTGSNGKSTLIQALTALAGNENVTSLTLGDISKEYYRQMLDGKILNIAEETPSRSLSDSSIFKNLVTGGRTTVRKIYQDPYEMCSRAKLVFSCNAIPPTEDTTDALFRRLIIVPFRAKFEPGSPGFDPFLGEKLILELPGIFNRVLAAYKDLWARKSFTSADASRAALDDYSRSINPMIEWLEEHVEFYPLGNGHDTAIATVRQFYDAYRADIESQGFRPLNITAFGHELKRLRPDYMERKDTQRRDGRPQKVIKAVKLHVVKTH